MPQPFSFGHVGVGLTTDWASQGGAVQPETPLCIGILGDFRRRGPAPGVPPAPRLADRRPVLVDRDNLDEVLAKFGVELCLSLDGEQVSVRFAGLDDFHPDRLFQRVETFQALRELRGKLSDPTTFAAAAAELLRAGSASAPPAPPPSAVTPPDLLEQMLREPRERPQPGLRLPGLGDLQAFIDKVVGPYSTPALDYARQAELLGLVDGLISQRMRALLHHPDFQALEAAWRAVHFLVHRLETGGLLKLYLLDLSKAELTADLGLSENLCSTGTYRLLVEQTVGSPGGQPWGLLVGLYPFDARREDVESLGRLAKIARSAGAPFLAAADSRILGCESLALTPDPDDWHTPLEPDEAAAWQALRHLPEASSLGLALPRFLLRLPYGKGTCPTEQFHFEEMPEGSRHEMYLWGHPAVACANLIASAYQQSGWHFRPGEVQEVAGLPAHVYREDGESQMKPCAEVVLTERAIGAITHRGLLPLLSVRGRDVVRVPWFCSLAEPAAPLAGRWER